MYIICKYVCTYLSIFYVLPYYWNFHGKSVKVVLIYIVPIYYYSKVKTNR